MIENYKFILSKTLVATIAAFLFACIGCVPATESVRVTSVRDVDSVEVRLADSRITLSIRSAQGIGSLTLEKTSNNWPTEIEARLYLNGLEHFEIYNGATRIEAAVSITGQDTRQWKDGNEATPLDSSSDYWMTIQTTKDRPDIESDDYFSITLPKRLLADAGESIEIKWIDFYR